MRLMRSIFKIYYQILKYIIILVDNIPRKIKKSIDDIIKYLYEHNIVSIKKLKEKSSKNTYFLLFV